MIIYNVTTKADHSIAAEWLQWLKEEHIPEMIATGCFEDATVLQLIDIDQTDGLTYAVQYHAQSKEQYHLYLQQHAGAIRKKVTEKWGTRIISFRTVMTVVN